MKDTTQVVQLAVHLKQTANLNCAQAVVKALMTEFSVAGQETIVAACSGLGAGMGCGRGTCGALLGAGLVVGAIASDKHKARPVVAGLMGDFELQAGSSICEVLKGKNGRALAFGCNECVSLATKLAAVRILEL